MRSHHPVSRLALLAAACFASASHAAAEVAYVQDLTFSINNPLGPLLPSTKAPIDTSDPLYDPDLPDTQRMVTTDLTTPGSAAYYTFDPVTGIASTGRLLQDVKADGFTLTAQSGVGTSEPMLHVLGFRSELYRYSFVTQSLVATPVPVPMLEVSSLAMADRTNMTAIGKGGPADPVGLFSIDITTGAATLDVTFAGGTLPGEFSEETLYHAYGPDGLVYLLDYGNDRMQMLDPEDAFAFVGEFALDPGVANMQFAIGPGGDVYLGDGAGGGFSYTALGVFREAFTLPESAGDAIDIGIPYLSTDASGHVYVFDDTGYHQYAVTAVPESATWGALLGTALLGMALLRHRSRRAL